MAKSAFRGSPRMSASGGGQSAMLRQAQKMQEEMLKAQTEVEDAEFEAAAGGGAVTAKVSGKKELLALTIAPEAVDPDDTEMLQELVVAAVNEALRKADSAMSDKMGSFTGGLGGLF
ncbi:MAG: YbaB/EbfC family nucleoid-associated protein [Oscillospiraceae bacterium]|nr:YbaB/EbfC family nucleoid-associated protein [Oscillospiraceae bacterium]